MTTLYTAQQKKKKIQNIINEYRHTLLSFILVTSPFKPPKQENTTSSLPKCQKIRTIKKVKSYRCGIFVRLLKTKNILQSVDDQKITSLINDMQPSLVKALSVIQSRHTSRQFYFVDDDGEYYEQRIFLKLQSKSRYRDCNCKSMENCKDTRKQCQISCKKCSELSATRNCRTSLLLLS